MGCSNLRQARFEPERKLGLYVVTDAPVSTAVKLDHSMIDCEVTTRPGGMSVLKLVGVVAGVIVGMSIAILATAWQNQLIGEHYWIAPDPVSLRSDFTVCARGLEPYAVVDVRLGYRLSGDQFGVQKLASGQVESTGSICITSRLPGGTGLGVGALELTKMGGWSGHATVPLRVVP